MKKILYSLIRQRKDRRQKLLIVLLIEILSVSIADRLTEGVKKSGMTVSGKRRNFPNICTDEKSYLKMNLAGNLVPTLITNTWLGNGKTFTEFNPCGKNPPGTEPYLDFEYCLMAGIDGITRIVKGESPVYVFGSVKALAVATLGDELYNANLETSRFQLQLFPKGWRLTGQYSFFKANQLNTIPSPPAGTFTDRQIGHEATLITDRFVSRNIYLRMMVTSLRAGKGIADVLPETLQNPELNS